MLAFVHSLVSWTLLGLIVTSLYRTELAAAELEQTLERVVATAAALSDMANSSSSGRLGPWQPEVNLTSAFLEQFPPHALTTRWIISQVTDATDKTPKEKRYTGQWALEAPPTAPGYPVQGDLALHVKTPGAHHAISAAFDAPITPNDETPLVVQYEVRTAAGLECGGAYVKLLTAVPGLERRLGAFDASTPYSLMFGPDRCGAVNKVHVIVRHTSPVTGNVTEHHFVRAPMPPATRDTTLYTLIVRPDETLEVLVNNRVAARGSLLVDMAPPINPPAEIDDPADAKPADWADEPEIPDPDAVKPADWDDDAPSMVLDTAAERPDDWLPDEPLFVPDPEAAAPADWNTEEDGDYTAPLVANPRCAQVSGCGPWKAPLVPNPAFRGVWKAPMIANPAYRGPWKPRRIPNPDYFRNDHPHRLAPMGGIGFELWTMQGDISFDNIYVGRSVSDAKRLADATWALKHRAEHAAAHGVGQDDVFDTSASWPVALWRTFKRRGRIAYAAFRYRLQYLAEDAVEWATLAMLEGPRAAWEADAETPLLALAAIAAAILGLSVLWRVLPGPMQRRDPSELLPRDTPFKSAISVESSDSGSLPALEKSEI